MLSKERQQDYFRQRWENIMQHFEQFAKHTNADDIHKIRVEVKKIRTLLFIEKELHGRAHDKARKLIMKIFHQAAKIREPQVSAQLVKEAGVTDAQFFSDHRNTVAKEAKAFNRLVKRNVDRLVKTNTAVWKSFKDISTKKLEKLVQDLLAKIRKTYRPRLKQNELHDSRKLIKRLVYIHGMTGKRTAQRLLLKINPLRKLEEEVGKWHDAVLTAELLKKIPGGNRKMKKLTAVKNRHLNSVKKLTKAAL